MKTSIERLLIAARNVVGAWDALDAAPLEEDGGLSAEHYRAMIDNAVEDLRSAVEEITQTKEAS